MKAEQIHQQFGVGGIVLGAADPKGFPIACQRLGIDRIERISKSNGMPQVSGRLWKVSPPQGGVA